MSARGAEPRDKGPWMLELRHRRSNNMYTAGMRRRVPWLPEDSSPPPSTFESVQASMNFTICGWSRCCKRLNSVISLKWRLSTCAAVVCRTRGLLDLGGVRSYFVLMREEATALFHGTALVSPRQRRQTIPANDVTRSMDVAATNARRCLLRPAWSAIHLAACGWLD